MCLFQKHSNSLSLVILSVHFIFGLLRFLNPGFSVCHWFCQCIQETSRVLTTSSCYVGAYQRDIFVADFIEAYYSAQKASYYFIYHCYWRVTLASIYLCSWIMDKVRFSSFYYIAAMQNLLYFIISVTMSFYWLN